MKEHQTKLNVTRASLSICQPEFSQVLQSWQTQNTNTKHKKLRRGGGRRGRGALAFLTPSLSFGMFDISVSFRRKRMKTTDRTLTKEAPQEVCFFFYKFLVCHKRCSELQHYCFNFVLVFILVYCINTPNSQSFIYHFMGLFGINIVTNTLLACLLSWQHTSLVLQRSWVQIPYRSECFLGLIFTTAFNVHYRQDCISENTYKLVFRYCTENELKQSKIQ